MTIQDMFYSLKKYGFVQDGEKYEIGDISEKTGLQKVGEGEWREPKQEILQVKATKKQIENLQTIEVKQGADKLDKSELKNIYKSLPDGENENDGIKVKFVKSTFGKIIGHGNNEIKKIIPQLTEIFNKSIPLHDSNYKSDTIRKDGSTHKNHNNFEGYHSYLGKIKDGYKTFYARFTIQELKSGTDEHLKNQFHDVFVSDIELYDEKAIHSRNLSDNNRATDEQTAYDKILAQALNEINKKETNDSDLILTLIKRPT